MSFADDFGHNIPPDDWDGGGYRRRDSNYSRNRSYYIPRHNPLFDIVKKLYIKVVKETDKAYLLQFEEGEAWLPKSKSSINSKDSYVYLPKWLKNNLEYKK
jgi:hypothetical protein